MNMMYVNQERKREKVAVYILKKFGKEVYVTVIKGTT